MKTGRNWVLALTLALAPLGGAWADAEEDARLGMERWENSDLIAAMTYLRRAAEAGHIGAQTKLAYILDKSEENEEAVSWYRRAAEAGGAEAAFELAIMYINGEGVERDEAQVAHWLRRSAEQEFVSAMGVYAKALELGQYGLEADAAAALEWYAKAAEAGYQAAQVRLLAVYSEGGLGVEPDPAQAEAWRQRLQGQ